MSKKPTPQPEKIGHLTMGKLAMSLGHTVPAMRKHLADLGILGPDGKPSEDAVASSLVKAVAGNDFKDPTKKTTFWVYDADYIVPRAPKGDVAEKMARLTSVDQARDRVENIFQYALKALKAPTDIQKQRSWARAAGLDKAVVSQLDDLEFQSMDFLGGPFVFEMLERPDQAMLVKEKARPLTDALRQLMVRSNLTEQAEVFHRAMDMVFSNVQGKLEDMEARQQASLNGMKRPPARRVRP